jgi:hypothetical protein
LHKATIELQNGRVSSPVQIGQFHSIIHRGIYIIKTAKDNYEKDLAKLFALKLRKFAAAANVPNF